MRADALPCLGWSEATVVARPPAAGRPRPPRRRADRHRARAPCRRDRAARRRRAGRRPARGAATRLVAVVVALGWGKRHKGHTEKRCSDGARGLGRVRSRWSRPVRFRHPDSVAGLGLPLLRAMARAGVVLVDPTTPRDAAGPGQADDRAGSDGQSAPWPWRCSPNGSREWANLKTANSSGFSKWPDRPLLVDRATDQPVRRSCAAAAEIT